MAKSYLYAVQDQDGRELLSWQGEVEKVGDITAEHRIAQIALVQEGTGTLALGDVVEGFDYTLYRWPADDKLAEPVAHRITVDYEES